MPRTVAWGIVLAFFAADAVMLRIYWPTLNEPLGAAGAMTVNQTAAAHPAPAPRLPGTIRRNVSGYWSILCQTLSLNAQPTNSTGFIFKYAYIGAAPGDVADWRTMLKLRGNLARVTAYWRGTLPDGLSPSQFISLRPLLLPLTPPIDPQLKHAMETELTALATKAANKSPSLPVFFADEQQLLDNLTIASKAAEPALHTRLAQIRAIVGDAQWAQISPARAPATRPLARPATRPSAPTPAAVFPLSLDSGRGPG
ncbi:MAG: hypothetical protein ABSH22_14540 [Tepidisphaeraceae bacterium]